MPAASELEFVLHFPFPAKENSCALSYAYDSVTAVVSDTEKQVHAEESPVSFRCPPEALTLLERVRKEQGARNRTAVILRAIFSHYRSSLSKRERAAAEKFIKEAA